MSDSQKKPKRFGQPKHVIPAFSGSIEFVRRNISKAKHDDVLKVEYLNRTELQDQALRLMEEFKHSMILTIIDFKYRGKLWAYILCQYKNVH